MTKFKVYRLKPGKKEQFRWQVHTKDPSTLNPKDYELETEIEASGFYSAWALLRERGKPAEVGDALEAEDGELRICKFTGLELASWIQVETNEPPNLEQSRQTATVPGSAEVKPGEYVDLSS